MDDVPPPIEAFFFEHVTVIIGPQKREFRVHRDVLVHHSGYSKAALFLPSS